MNAFAGLIGALMIGTEPPELPGDFLPYDRAVPQAQKMGQPLITFHHCQPRQVYGCVAAHVAEPERLKGVPSPAVVVCVFGHGVRASYAFPPEAATDAALAAKVLELRAQLTPVRVEFVAPPPPAALHRMIQGYDPSCRTG